MSTNTQCKKTNCTQNYKSLSSQIMSKIKPWTKIQVLHQYLYMEHDTVLTCDNQQRLSNRNNRW